MVKIAFDAGHGFYTSGKRTPAGEREWSFNNKVALAFEKEMLTYVGAELRRFDDRTGKTDVPLITRTTGANRWGADYFISFHHNANTGKWGSWGGVETFVYLGNKVTKSGKLANAVQPALVKAYGLRNRGIKEKNLHILRETNCPAILIEGGFMDSTTDINALRNDTVLAEAGKAIAQAVAKVIGLKKKVVKPSKPAVKPEVIVPKEVEEYNMKMHEVTGCSKYTVDQLAKVYKEAYEAGILSSDKWYKKAQIYEITLGEVAYLATVLVSRIGTK